MAEIYHQLHKPIYDLFKRTFPNYFRLEFMKTIGFMQPKKTAHKAVKDSFEYLRRFEQDLELKPHNQQDLMFEWLKYISHLWEHKFSSNIIHLYIKMYERYQAQSQPMLWIGQRNYNDFVKIGVFYIELKIELKLNESVEPLFEADDTTFLLLHMLKSASLIEPVTRLRLYLLEYRYALQAKYGGMALNVLQKMQDVFDSSAVKFLLLSNQTQFRQIDIELINQERGKLLNYRQLAIDIKRKFDKMRIEQVIPTLLTFRIENFESDQMSATKQTEMLLDCFWEDECDVDGVLLAEAALYESMNVWMLHAGCDDKALANCKQTNTQRLSHLQPREGNHRTIRNREFCAEVLKSKDAVEAICGVWIKI